MSHVETTSLSDALAILEAVRAGSQTPSILQITAALVRTGDITTQEVNHGNE